MRQVLSELNARRTSGAYVAYPGDELAERVGCERGQNGIAEAIRDFRNRVIELLAEQTNVTIGRFDVLQSGGPGYRFNPWIKVVVADANMAATESGAGDSGEKAVVSEPPAAESRRVDSWNVRQQWRCRPWGPAAGEDVRVATLVAKFGCSAATAKRDLAQLRERGLTRFEGSAKTGVYRVGRGKE